MSALLLGTVFKRLETSGGELLLALALADHAKDDGSSIFPSVPSLAIKTRQSERTVQRQLRRLEALGWLIPVNNLHGGRYKSREYRISTEWINGDNLSPHNKSLTPKNGVSLSPLPHERVTPLSQKGDTAMSQKGDTAMAPKPSITINNHHEDKDSAEPQAASAQTGTGDPVIFMPIAGKGTPQIGIGSDLVAELKIAFPGVDIPQQLKVMRVWLLTNPTRRKTARGLGRFIASWCEREQNKPSLSTPGSGRRLSAPERVREAGLQLLERHGERPLEHLDA